MIRDYRKQVAAMKCEYELFCATYSYNAESIRLEAEKKMELVKNEAYAALAKSLAASQAVYETGLAQAKKTRSLQTVRAEAGLWTAQAQAEISAIQRFYTPNANAPHATYELAKANANVEHIGKIATAYLTWATDHYDAVYVDEINTIAANFRMQSGGGNGGLIDLQLNLANARAEAIYQREEAIIRDECGKKMMEQQNAMEKSHLWEDTLYMGKNCLANLSYDMGMVYAECDVQGFSADSYLKRQEIGGTNNAEIDEKLIFVEGGATGWAELYWKYLEANIRQYEAEYFGSIAATNAQFTCKEAILLAEREYALASMRLKAGYDADILTSVREKDETQLQADLLYQKAFVTSELVMQEASTTAWRDYHVDVAGDYLQEIAIWNASENSAWSRYQYDVAAANVAWIVSTVDNQLNYAKGEIAVQQDLLMSQYDTQHTWIQNGISAKFDYYQELNAAIQSLNSSLEASQFAYQIQKNQVDREMDIAYLNDLVLRDTDRQLAVIGYHQSQYKTSGGMMQPLREIDKANDEKYAASLFGGPGYTPLSNAEASDAYSHALIAIKNDYNVVNANVNTTYTILKSADRAYEATRGIADAADTLAATATRASATYTATKHEAEMEYAKAMAGFDYSYTVTLAGLGYKAENAMATLWAGACETEFQTNWQLQFAVADAAKAYEKILYEENLTQTITNYTADPSPWNLLQQRTAAADFAYVADAWMTWDAYMMAIYDADAAKLRSDIGNNLDYNHQAAVQNKALQESLAATIKGRDIAVAVAVTERDMLEENAAVKRDFLTRQLEIEYDMDVADCIYEQAVEYANAEFVFNEVYHRQEILSYVKMADGLYHLNRELYNKIGAGSYNKLYKYWEDADKACVKEIGQAQRTRAEALGDVETQYAESLFDARTSAVQDINNAELDYVNACNSIRENWVSAMARADAAYQTTSTDSDMRFAIAVGAADVNYAAAGQHKVIWATASATAQTEYLVSLAEEKAKNLVTSLNANSSIQDRYNAALAQSHLAWLLVTQEAYIVNLTASIESDILLNYALTATSAMENAAMWAHYGQYVSTAAGANTLLANADNVAASIYATAATQSENNWYLEMETVEYERLIALAKVEKNRATQRAVAHDDFQQITYGKPTASRAPLDAAYAEYDLNTKIDRADVNFNYRAGVAGTGAVLGQALVQAEQTRLLADINAEGMFIQHESDAYTGLVDSLAQTQNLYTTAYAMHIVNWNNRQAELAADYLDITYAAMLDSSVTQPLVNATGNSAWMQSQLWKWGVQQQAWNAVRESYLDTASTIADLQYDYATDVAASLTRYQQQSARTLQQVETGFSNAVSQWVTGAAGVLVEGLGRESDILVERKKDFAGVQRQTEIDGKSASAQENAVRNLLALQLGGNSRTIDNDMRRASNTADLALSSLLADTQTGLNDLSFDFLGGVLRSTQRTTQAVTNAVFALVDTNAAALLEIVSPYTSDANPFIAYEAQKLTAEATHATSVAVTGKVYSNEQTVHDETHFVAKAATQRMYNTAMGVTPTTTPTSSDYDQEMGNLAELEVLRQYQQQLIQDGYNQTPTDATNISMPLPETVARGIPDAEAHQQTIYGRLDAFLLDSVREHMNRNGDGVAKAVPKREVPEITQDELALDMEIEELNARTELLFLQFQDRDIMTKALSATADARADASISRMKGRITGELKHATGELDAFLGLYLHGEQQTQIATDWQVEQKRIHDNLAWLRLIPGVDTLICLTALFEGGRNGEFFDKEQYSFDFYLSLADFTPEGLLGKVGKHSGKIAAIAAVSTADKLYTAFNAMRKTVPHVADFVRGASKLPDPTFGYKSYSAFTNAFGSAGPKCEWHHIVMQIDSNVSKFGPEVVHHPANLIPLPDDVHRLITGKQNSIWEAATGSRTMRLRDMLIKLDYSDQHEIGMLLMNGAAVGDMNSVAGRILKIFERALNK